MMEIGQNLKNRILRAQKNELTEHIIYKKLSEIARNAKIKRILEKISAQELSHYNFWKNYSHQVIAPNYFKAHFYCLISKFLGLNFGLRLMERGEKAAQTAYEELKKIHPKIKNILKDEQNHEDKLLDLLGKQELTYTGSIILGLNDALVELTGALAGFTLAFTETRIIAIAGLISGIAASLSMAGSEYLSTKEEGTREPIKASLYTGVAYILAVFLLILPYFIFKSSLLSLATTLIIALLIILIFNFYISVAKNIPFKKRFLEMALISLGVMIISFFIGLLARKFLNIEI
ncbi:VIT1/CCC1 transporter family protein [Candidatus Woesearchaeota archaeon]|nr:VIT1/CCC1 transporter family protein [Candidatus Woesearchaeota archaeon]